MIKRISEYFKPKYKWALFSGFLVGISYIPFPPWALFFCYSPLWFFVFKQALPAQNHSSCQNWRQAFIAGWWTQFALSLIGFHWIAHLAHEFGFLPWPIAIIILLLFSAFIHLYIPISTALIWHLRKKWNLSLSTSLLCLACTMTLMEIFWPSIFNWNLGYPMFWAKWPMANLADVIGFQGLSFVVYLANAVITWLVIKTTTTRQTQTATPTNSSDQQMRPSASALATEIDAKSVSHPETASSQDKTDFNTNSTLEKPTPPVRLLVVSAALVVILLVLNFWGQQKSKYWQEQVQKSAHHLKVLVVQANIGNLEKYYAEKGMGYQQYIADQFFQLTLQGLREHPEADLVLWPESAFPDYLDNYAQTHKYPKQFRDFVRTINKPIMTGAYSKDEPGTKPRYDYNGLFLFNEQADLVLPVYHKNQLLIFGEYLPLVEQFPILAKWNPGGSGFGRGPGPQVINYKRPSTDPNQADDFIKLGVQICYESLDPQFSAKLSQQQAQILVNVTNDSWFGDRFEPWQHLYMTLGRAIETRRPLVRSTNTGISTAVLADGTVLEHSPLFQPWTGLFDVAYDTNPEPTFYTSYGHYLWLVLLLIFSTSLVTGIALKRKQE